MCRGEYRELLGKLIVFLIELVEANREVEYETNQEHEGEDEQEGRWIVYAHLTSEPVEKPKGESGTEEHHDQTNEKPEEGRLFAKIVMTYCAGGQGQENERARERE